MSNEQAVPVHKAVLVLPHIRVQNANAISSPMTWGFPAITAFTGMMSALERNLGRDAGIAFCGVGVICHRFEAQVTSEGYERAFHLTRNPVLADGSTAGIVEEGRAHLDVTLVFDVLVDDDHRGDAERAALAEQVAHQLAGMRLAGGSVMPALPGSARRSTQPVLAMVPDDHEEQRQQLRRLARQWMPGFALVSRDDLLQTRLAELRSADPAATALDAWLDLSRWNTRAVERRPQPEFAGDDSPPAVEWITDPRVGWTVPIPVGFAALSELHAPGTVGRARDTTTPFRFVETVWSIGQWVSPHRLKSVAELVWTTGHDPAHPTEHGLYRCRNAYVPATMSADMADTTPN